MCLVNVVALVFRFIAITKPAPWQNARAGQFLVDVGTEQVFRLGRHQAAARSGPPLWAESRDLAGMCMHAPQVLVYQGNVRSIALEFHCSRRVQRVFSGQYHIVLSSHFFITNYEETGATSKTYTPRASFSDG